MLATSAPSAPAKAVRPRPAHGPAHGLPQYVGKREIMAALDISESTFWRWCKAGIIPSGIRVGQVYRWPTSLIVELLERLNGGRAAEG